MTSEPTASRFPVGMGWVAGYVLAFLVGVIAGVVADDITIGLILCFATGTAFGVSFERSMDTRPLTERERRLALFLTVAGLVVGAGVLASVVLLA